MYLQLGLNTSKVNLSNNACLYELQNMLCGEPSLKIIGPGRPSLQQNWPGQPSIIFIYLYFYFCCIGSVTVFPRDGYFLAGPTFFLGWADSAKIISGLGWVSPKIFWPGWLSPKKLGRLGPSPERNGNERIIISKVLLCKCLTLYFLSFKNKVFIAR